MKRSIAANKQGKYVAFHARSIGCVGRSNEI